MIVVTVARKPLEKKTVAEQVLATGTGALHIDAARIATTETWSSPDRVIPNGLPGDTRTVAGQGRYAGVKPASQSHAAGRWPANLVLEHPSGCTSDSCVEGCPVAHLDASTAPTKSTPTVGGKKNIFANFTGETHIRTQATWYTDEGGVSRYFKVVK